VTTGNNGPDDTGGKPPRASGGPSPFTEEEIAAVTGPVDEDELEDSDVATIEAGSGGPRDLAGNALAAEKTWSFTVRR